jgi:hypothetical protein
VNDQERLEVEKHAAHLRFLLRVSDWASDEDLKPLLDELARIKRKLASDVNPWRCVIPWNRPRR